MKIKITSDLHIHGNLDSFSNIQESKENYDLLIIAGDISSDAATEINFLKTLSKETVCVAGNHLGYNSYKNFLFHQLLYPCDKSNFTLEHEIKNIQTYFKDTNIHYLQNDYFKFNDKVIFGGTMYTNFELYGKKHKEECMYNAKLHIGDFETVWVDKKDVRYVTPQDYVKYFNTFMRKLKKCIKETSEDIIVITHFAPSRKAISEEYKNSAINSYFVTDLEAFIKENPRIKLWIHGHVHTPCMYNIGECKVVCNPFGYIEENYKDIKNYNEVIIKI